MSGTSNLNYAAGETESNLIIAAVDANGQITLTNTSTSSVRLAIDIMGWMNNNADG